MKRLFFLLAIICSLNVCAQTNSGSPGVKQTTATTDTSAPGKQPVIDLPGRKAAVDSQDDTLGNKKDDHHIQQRKKAQKKRNKQLVKNNKRSATVQNELMSAKIQTDDFFNANNTLFDSALYHETNDDKAVYDSGYLARERYALDLYQEQGKLDIAKQKIYLDLQKQQYELERQERNITKRRKGGRQHNNRFSLGIGGFAGGGNYFDYDTYGWQKLPSTGNIVNGNATSDTFQLVRNGRTSAPIGFCVMGTVKLIPTDYWLNIGASAGLGYAVNSDLPLTYMGGVSLLVGNRGQLNITYGIAAKQIYTLQTATYQPDPLYTAPGSVPYNKTLAIGTFLSVTYKLFNL